MGRTGPSDAGSTIARALAGRAERWEEATVVDTGADPADACRQAFEAVPSTHPGRGVAPVGGVFA